MEYPRSVPSPQVSELTRVGSDEFAEGEITSNEDSPMAELNPREWTNEKHNMFLKSIEASFVNQLYNHDKPGFEANRVKRDPRLMNYDGLQYNSLQRHSDCFRTRDSDCNSEVIDQNFSDEEKGEEASSASKSKKKIETLDDLKLLFQARIS